MRCSICGRPLTQFNIFKVGICKSCIDSYYEKLSSPKAHYERLMRKEKEKRKE